jgi:integrase/recombinase XerD
MESNLDNLARDLALKGYAQSTQKKYLSRARKLMERFGRPPEAITPDELRTYVEELRQQYKSASRLTEALSALLFLYRKTLGTPEVVSFISIPKKYSALPTVLSVKEVHALLSHVKHPRYRMLAMVLYGCGLRVSEAIALECRDIDGSRGVLYIRHGKGNVAREAKLSNELYLALRQYWAQERPEGPHVFASKSGRLPQADTIRTALRKAAQAAGIKKSVYPHVLRHSFATHLLEQGIDSRVVSALLGHKSFQSTERYARVTRPIIRQTPSPLDLLPHRRR